MQVACTNQLRGSVVNSSLVAPHTKEELCYNCKYVFAFFFFFVFSNTSVSLVV